MNVNSPKWLSYKTKIPKKPSFCDLVLGVYGYYMAAGLGEVGPSFTLLNVALCV